MIAVVIATYNEADNIGELLYQLSDYEVIIVDDNSPDGTAEIARTFKNTHVIVPPKRLGIARSYRLGFKAALELNPEYVIQMDAGFTHNPKDINGMVNLAKNGGYNLVYASRFSNNFKVKGYRTLISLSARLLMSFIHVHMDDVTCGFRCWKPILLRDICSTMWLSKGFAFQLETAHMASQLTKFIKSFPIEYKLSNSSFNLKILMEALWIYSIMLLN